MIRIAQISPASLHAFRDTRLRALQDTPTAFGSTYARESQLTDADWQRRIALWNSERSISYLAWDDDKPCGIVAGMIHPDDSIKADLLSMWVAPTHRRRGVGRMLVDGVLAWARSRHVQSMRLCVTCNNVSAIQFYERLGFAQTGNTEPYPNDPALVEFEMIRMMAE
jgi:ribosomal protein S18 acetylase RimI-like enzyme